MIKLTVGIIIGIAIATVGVGGIVNIADKGVSVTKNVVQEAAQK